MNKDQIKGQIKSAKGGVKEVAGKMVGNEKLEERGSAEQVAGNIQSSVGDMKQDIHGLKKDLKKKLHDIVDKS